MHSEPQLPNSTTITDITAIPPAGYRSSASQNADRLTTIRQEMEYLNTIGKRFVAAIDRFQVHHALLAALQDLYHFSACTILLKGDPFELSVIPCYPLNAAFLQSMIQRITSAADVIDFPHITPEDLAVAAYLDAPDELSTVSAHKPDEGATIGSCLNIPLTVENRIIGLLSLFDDQIGTFDTELLKLTTMIADYAAIALENVRLREREHALWRQTELDRLRLELIISSMAEGLLITDERGTITLLNHSARNLLAQAQHIIEQDAPLRTLAANGDIEWLRTLSTIIDLALAGHTVLHQELIAGESGENVPLTLSISAAPLENTSNPLLPSSGVVAVLNDVTSQKQVEKLKDEFVSIVSHELRTPLTAIKGYTQHLMRRIERRLRKTKHEGAPTHSAEQPEALDLRSLAIVQSQAEHLERIVNDLLDLSRVQWGRLNLSYNSFSLVDVLSDCVRSAQASAEQHSIYLDIQTSDSSIIADQARIIQVIGNILDNAVKYSPHGGHIIVRLEDGNGEYRISVIDEGIGISAEYLDHIFERFYRVRNKASRQYSGIGLGLYVTKAIVEGHGGRIEVSNNQGIGSTFSFTLPRTPQP